ncbi:MAG: M48 family metallopeptidase [Candidatus Pacearchaeota archaeon]
MKNKVKHIDFRDQISRNKRNSILLLLFVFLILIFLGYLIGKIIKADFFIFMTIFSLFSIFYIWLTYYFSAQISLWSVNAKEASREKYKYLYNMVEGLTLASGLPMPKVYIMEQQAINAFATGRNPKNAVVCVTTGALEKLNKDELEGVIAHELSHIKNYDIRFVTIVAVVVGLIEILAQMFIRSLFYSSHYRNRNERGNIIFFIIGIILAILAPIIVKLVQLAISRRREYMADAGAVEITRYPDGLANALKKIKNDSKPLNVNKAVAPMFISDPAKQRIINLFQTHPPIDERIRILESM